jgi:hypothetical protein
VGGRIYRESFKATVHAELGRFAQNGYHSTSYDAFDAFGLTAWIHEFNRIEGAFLVVSEDGGVAFGFTEPRADGGLHMATDQAAVTSVLACLERLSSEIGAAGRCHVRLWAARPHAPGVGSDNLMAIRDESTDAVAWVTIGDKPDADTVARLVRDLNRRHGRRVHEPER